MHPVQPQAHCQCRSDMSGWQTNGMSGTSGGLTCFRKAVHRELQELVHSEAHNWRGREGEGVSFRNAPQTGPPRHCGVRTAQ